MHYRTTRPRAAQPRGAQVLKNKKTKQNTANNYFSDFQKVDLLTPVEVEADLMDPKALGACAQLPPCL